MDAWLRVLLLWDRSREPVVKIWCFQSELHRLLFTTDRGTGVHEIMKRNGFPYVLALDSGATRRGLITEAEWDKLRTLAQSEKNAPKALPTRLALLRTEDVASAMANHRTNAMARKVAAALTDWVESRGADFRTLSS